MKYRVLVALAVVALVGWLAFGLGRSACTCAQGMASLQTVPALTRGLTLAESQERKLAALHETWQAKMLDCCAHHCDARRALASALTQPSPDPTSINDSLDSLSEAYARSERLAAEHIAGIREILDMEQRKRFDRMLVDALTCRHCPACDTHAKPCDDH